MSQYPKLTEAIKHHMRLEMNFGDCILSEIPLPKPGRRTQQLDNRELNECCEELADAGVEYAIKDLKKLRADAEARRVARIANDKKDNE